jgi:hypothetical protein
MGKPLSAKLMFPETAGLFVPVTYGPSGKKHYEAAEGSDFVGETEGIEDALSAALEQRRADPHARDAGSLSGYLGSAGSARAARGYLLFRDNDWGKPQAAAQFDRADRPALKLVRQAGGDRQRAGRLGQRHERRTQP